MEILKNAVFGVVALVVLVFGLSSIIPPTYKVERTIAIEAPRATVFSQVADLRQWQNWAVRFQRDPAITVAFSGPEMGVGMAAAWQSATEGNGSIAIKKISPDETLVYEFVNLDLDTQSKIKLTLQEENGATTITWTDSGKIAGNPLNRYLLLLVDDMLGPDIEENLRNLKGVIKP